MIARKIAPALAAGCTVVAKPAEDTPLTSLALVRLAEEAGIPSGVLNIVTASREMTPEVVDVWLADARVRKITFTGSTPVGKHLAHQSAGTLKKLSLELGGNAPFIVFDDADIDAAVEGLMVAKFRNGGQTCVCPNRVFVQEGVHNAFVDKLVIARVWRLADALESGIVGINEGALAAEVAPFGGIKESGYGREGSRYGLDHYMHTKYLCQGQLA